MTNRSGQWVPAPFERAGLPSPSVIRTVKIVTIEAVDASKIGSMSPSQLKVVKQLIIQELN